ncbi:hypothetical protein [Myxococcus eversor]|uniref:hypothetical protein n=1 Tax=Myxococcus eversor TaxID=2709661 RepID=UPI0013D6FA65|nr:hypothetical protein [Myxococcus eversor]
MGWGLERIDAEGRRLEQLPVWISSGRPLYFKVHAAETTYLRMSTIHSELSGPYSCKLEDLGPDDHGDTLDTATPWSPDTVATGVMELVTDVDVFALSLRRGAFYRVVCTSQLPSVPCKVNVLSPTGVSTGEPASTASFNASHDGTYRVEVTSTFAQDVVIQAAYSLQLENLGTDDHGDTREHATRLMPSPSPFSGMLSGAMDRDVFSFSTQVGHAYLFICDVLPGQLLAPRLVLLDAAGRQVEIAPYFQEQPTRVSVEATTATEYFVELSYGTYVGTYSCRLEDLGFDDHADSSVGATVVMLSTRLTGHLETRSDVDVFAFPMRPGHFYSFQWKGGTSSPGAVWLKNAQGTVLQTMNFGGFTYLASSEERYTLEVDAAPLGRAGTFSIEATDLGPDDHGDTPETATLLEPGLPLSGARYLGSDRDVFVFSMEENTLYRVNCTGCDVTFQSPGGQPRTLKTTRNSTISYHLDAYATAPVYITIYSGSLYQLSLEYLGKDDHGDDTDHATGITYPLNLQAALDSVFDVDVFSLSLLAGQTHRVRAIAGFSTVVSVLAPDGTEVTKSFEGDFTPTQSGLHHIQVRPNLTVWSYPSGPYRLTFD